MSRHEKKSRNREKYWWERVAAHERSGLSVKQFCEQQKITEQTFYAWRKRLRNRPPLRFELVETDPARPQTRGETGLELLLTTGERLRIGADVDATTLRTVVETLRG